MASVEAGAEDYAALAEQAQAASARQEQLFHELIDRCPFGIYIVDADLRIASMNKGSQEGAFVNVRPVIGRSFDEAMHILWPSPVAQEIIGRFRHTLDTGEAFHSRDFVRPRNDVDEVEGYEWELHRTTLPDGRFGVICYYFDATELRRTQRSLQESLQRQNLLTGELNHRVKNSLAIVQSLAHQSFRGSDIPADALRAFEGRLGSLAAAHAVLTRHEWESAEVGEIVATACDACSVEGRFIVAGPFVRLQPSAAVTMALALHELCTNATKYGALSNDQGQVHISWTVGSGDVPSFRFVWEERDGPPVAPPARRGFGASMIERALASGLGGTVNLDFRPSGLTCTVESPLGKE